MDAVVRRLNFGAGIPAPNWLNLDVSLRFRFPRVLHQILAATRLSQFSQSFCVNHYAFFHYRTGRRLPFDDQSVEAIYCSHVLEHLHHDEAAALLAEFRRVIAPKGIVRCVVPDMRSTLTEAMNREEGMLDFTEILMTLPYFGRSHRLRAVNEALHGFPGCHKTMFYTPGLRRTLAGSWAVEEKDGYLDSALDGAILKDVEREAACVKALVFELSPRHNDQKV